MEKLFGLLAILTVVYLAFVGIANATVITFEDLYTDYADPLPSGYAGFTWSSSAYVIVKSAAPGTGYEYGTLGNYSLFNAFGDDISFGKAEHFNFISTYLTSAFFSDHSVTLEGWRDGAEIYTQTVLTHNDQPYLFNFNYQDIDTLWIKSGNAQRCQVVLDNITYNEQVIPEPATLSLLGLGLLGLVFKRRKISK